MQRAPQRVVAAIVSQPVGHRPDKPDYMYESGRDIRANEFLGRRPDVSMLKARTINRARTFLKRHQTA